MSRVFIGLLVSTFLPKFGAQLHLALDQSPCSFHASSRHKFKPRHPISDGFDKPSAVRLKSNNTGDSFSASVYKCNPDKGSCDLNVYDIFSNDQQTDQIRGDYEVWNFANHAAHRNHGIRRLSKRNQEMMAKSKVRYAKLVDSLENKPYVLDDDYSLVNYVDNWKGLDPDHKIRRFHRKSEKRIEARKLHLKRDLEDKEFQVEFHSSKDNEFKGKLPSSYELVNARQRKSSINHRKGKSSYRPQYGRNHGYFDSPINHYKSKPTYTACKKKCLWGRKRAKVYPKLGPKSGFLDELETRSRSNMAAMGHVWHWATTRKYVMAAITPRKEFVTPHSQEMGIMPQVFIPVMNLSDSLVSKSFEANMNPPQIHPVQFQAAAAAQKSLPHYIPNGNLPVGPSNREVGLALKPVLNRNQPQNLGSPTRRPLIFFNRPTEFINPYENHYDNFKNTPFWNARQGPPELRGVLGSPVRFSNLQGFKFAPNVMQNEQFVKPMSLPRLFENIREEPSMAKSINNSGIIQKFKVLPVTKQEPVPVKQTPKPFETADIVNLLQSALLPQNNEIHQVATTTEETMCALLPKSIPIDKMLDLIAPSRSTLPSISKPLSQAPTGNAVQSVTEDSKLIVDSTKEALISLFTTDEEPMMESLEDILRRNTDRKIPIVYDIEDAPQLSAQKSTDNPIKNISNFQDGRLTEPKPHVLNRRGILKKNKTAIKHKTIQKTNSANMTLTTPWIVLATTENMLYSEIMEMERLKLNMTKKSKSRKSTSRTKMNLLFKNKVNSNETTNVTKATDEPKVKSKRDQKAVASSRPGKPYYEPVTSDLRCGECTCGCHTTPRPTLCCRCRQQQPLELTTKCRQQQPLELTTKVSCGPASLSSGSISCPDCHQEFTYKLGLRPLVNC